MRPQFETIDAYIANAPENVRALLKQLRHIVRKAAPNASEKISYGVPTFYLNGNLVHFAAFRNHIGFYPTPSGIAAFQEKLKEFKTAKGSAQFPLDRPLPAKLIAEIVRHRVHENTAKATKPTRGSGAQRDRRAVDSSRAAR